MVRMIRSIQKIPLVLILFLMMIISFKLTGQSSSNYTIQKDVISSAGSPSSSVNFELNGAMGQPSVIGEAASMNYSLSSGFFADFGMMTAIESEGAPILAETLVLYQNYPNPFTTMTTIRFSLPEAGQVKLDVYNILGKHIAALINEYRSPGIYFINYNGTALSPGVYLYKIQTKQNQAVKMMNKLE